MPSVHRVSEPYEPAAASSRASRLGNLRSSHGSLYRRKLMVAAGTGLLLASVGAVMALMHGVVFAEISGVIALGVTAVLAGKAALSRNLRVELYDAGLVVVRGTQRNIVLFEDVDSVWYELNTLSSPLGRYALILALRLVEHTGNECRIPLQIRDAVVVVRWVFRQCSDPLLGDARSTLQSGGELEFGPVRLTRESITLRGTQVRWQDLRLVRMQSGRIVFFRRWPIIPWRIISLDRVPHPGVFSCLVRESAQHVELDLPPGLSEA